MSYLEPGYAVRHVRCSCTELGRTQYSADMLCMPLHSPICKAAI